MSATELLRHFPARSGLAVERTRAVPPTHRATRRCSQCLPLCRPRPRRSRRFARISEARGQGRAKGPARRHSDDDQGPSGCPRLVDSEGLRSSPIQPGRGNEGFAGRRPHARARAPSCSADQHAGIRLEGRHRRPAHRDQPEFLETQKTCGGFERHGRGRSRRGDGWACSISLRRRRSIRSRRGSAVSTAQLRRVLGYYAYCRHPDSGPVRQLAVPSAADPVLVIAWAPNRASTGRPQGGAKLADRMGRRRSACAYSGDHQPRLCLDDDRRLSTSPPPASPSSQPRRSRSRIANPGSNASTVSGSREGTRRPSSRGRDVNDRTARLPAIGAWQSRRTPPYADAPSLRAARGAAGGVAGGSGSAVKRSASADRADAAHQPAACEVRQLSTR